MRPTLLPLLILLVIAPRALADGLPVRDGPVAAELIAEYEPFRPGRSVTLAVVLHLDVGWHAYWLNPGDAGQPPEVEWTLPEGFELGLMEWPAPHLLVEGPIVSFVYEGELVLPVTLYVPKEAAEGEVTIRANLKWLACKDQCLPGRAEVSLTRPVRDGLTKVDKRAHQLISKTRDLLPVPTEASVSYDARRNRMRLQGKVAEGTPITFFPEALGAFDLAALGEPTINPMDSTWSFELPLADGAARPEQLTGVLVTTHPRRAYAVNAPVKAPSSNQAARSHADRETGGGLSTIGIMGITVVGLVLLLLIAMAVLRSGRRNQP